MKPRLLFLRRMATLKSTAQTEAISVANSFLPPISWFVKERIVVVVLFESKLPFCLLLLIFYACCVFLERHVGRWLRACIRAYT